MTTNKIEKIEKSIFDEDMEKQLEIVKLLNSLYKITYHKYYTELIIEDDKKAIIFQRVKNKLKHFEGLALVYDENVEPLFAIATFKVLFMKENKFNLSKFKVKKKYFDIILNLLSNKELIGEELKDLKDLTRKIMNSEFMDFTTKITENGKKNLIFPYCCYIINKYSKSKGILINLFIFFLKKQFLLLNKNDLELIQDFSEKDFQKIKLKDLLEDFESINEKVENYIIIYIDNGHLKMKKMSAEQITQIINDENDENENEEKKQDKSQNKEKDIKEEEDKDEEEEESKDEINLNGNNNQNLNVSEKQSNEKDYKISESESRENNIFQSCDKSLEAIQEKFEKEMEDIKKHFNQELKKQKEINNNLEEEVKNLKMQITSINKKCKKLEKSSVYFQNVLEEINDKCENFDYVL